MRVPTAQGKLMFPEHLDPCVELIVLEDADYTEVIKFGNALAAEPDKQPEGGAKNVARRDGLATVLLAAVERMAHLPDHYFQAVGSGAGAIAVAEAAERVVQAGHGTTLPRLMICQNTSDAPLHRAWHDKDRPNTRPPARIFADELTNRLPPYSVRGGVRDHLVASGGDVLLADRNAAEDAMSMFLELEGVEPAAAVAVACLRAAVAEGLLVPATAEVEAEGALGG